MIIYTELHDGDLFIDIALLAKEIDAIRNGEEVQWRKDLSGVGVHINIRLVGSRKKKDNKDEEEKK